MMGERTFRLRMGNDNHGMATIAEALSGLFADLGWTYCTDASGVHHAVPGISRLCRAITSLVGHVRMGAYEAEGGRFVVRRTDDDEIEVLVSLGYVTSERVPVDG